VRHATQEAEVDERKAGCSCDLAMLLRLVLLAAAYAFVVWWLWREAPLT